MEEHEQPCPLCDKESLTLTHLKHVHDFTTLESYEAISACGLVSWGAFNQSKMRRTKEFRDAVINIHALKLLRRIGQ